MNENLSVFLQTNIDVCKLLGKMVVSEQEKRQALLAHDSEKIEHIVQSGQALSMQLKNLEEKRISAQNACGFAGLTLNQITEKLTNEDKIKFSPVFKELLSSAGLIKELNKVSMDLVNMELKFLGYTQNTGSGVYSAGGKKPSGIYNKNSFTGKA